MDTKSFVGKVAVVTGSASGIGRATAKAFAAQGAQVVVADLDEKGGEETRGQIVADGGKAIFVRTNVADSSSVSALIAETVRAFGRIDCAFNNAGINQGKSAPVADCEEDVWDKVIGVNLKGVWLCMKYELQQMVKQGAGTIVNTASTCGFRGVPTQPAYIASKHGIIGITRAAAVEYAQSGVRINAVCPGGIATPMAERAIAMGSAKGGANVPMARIGQPDEVARAVLWLSSDQSTYTTGHALAVDGGWLAA